MCRHGAAHESQSDKCNRRCHSEVDSCLRLTKTNRKFTGVGGRIGQKSVGCGLYLEPARTAEKDSGFTVSAECFKSKAWRKPGFMRDGFSVLVCRFLARIRCWRLPSTR